MASVDHTKRGTSIIKWTGIGCLGTVVLVALMTLYAVARTGIVRVPLLGAGFRPPEPTRVVNVGDTRPELLLESLFASTKLSLTKGGVTIDLSEELMTQLMRDSLSREQVPDFLIVEEMQVAALASGVLELYVPVEVKEGRRTAMIAQVSMDVDEEGSVVTAIEQVSIGNLKSRGGAPSQELDAWLGTMLDSLLSDAQDVVTITDIEILEGRVRVTGKIQPGAAW
ncbi:hypothetical protein A3C17_04505 [Candidatus Uhrbacteria bacterium RIFCSPHIGHO2_02_FULL_53_13]|uniref:Uncharacterized protein n=1 Tax=Candidatus Uhrbacteria bacterium RIFCSPHIGHO2_02_FULL_53_13 TaxID=1802389 RepID=A0A1F7TV60_9BACT|nr:MAG: hypothetical protein A3C17_04505 [Candidatus Uhrbacteria bacterium RIFCSPHIGHO2_02_FULL_53_13]